MPGRIGEFVALTGIWLNAVDCLHLGLELDALRDPSNAIDLVSERTNLRQGILSDWSTILEYQGEIDAVFCAPTAQKLLENLSTAKSDFGERTFELVSRYKLGSSQQKLDEIRACRAQTKSST